MIELVVATRSPDKLREIQQILGPAEGVRLRTLAEVGIAESEAEEGIEVYDTFEANALAKARFFAELVDAMVLADDSGLCVDALGGEPGVRSKRFSGRTDLRGVELDAANNRLLLQRLAGVPAEQRSARYVCAVALVEPQSGWEEVARGECEGAILDEARGTGGFGYDPLFYLPSEGRTFGEVDPQVKNRLSHRARAVRAAGELLRHRIRTAG